MANVKVKETAEKKNTRPSAAEINREKKELLNLLLKKAGITYKDLVTNSVGLWVASNTDRLTASEKKQFKLLHF